MCACFCYLNLRYVCHETITTDSHLLHANNLGLRDKHYKTLYIENSSFLKPFVILSVKLKNVLIRGIRFYIFFHFLFYNLTESTPSYSKHSLPVYYYYY